MGVFHHPGWQPLSDTGGILALGTLTFTGTGGTTPKNIYSDKALTQALSNPYTLDAAGRVADTIFMLEDAAYRVVLKNAAGTTIWTEDNQWARSISFDEGTRRKGIVRSPMDHGAAGDGSTNDATALAAALTAISSAGGGVLDLEGNTYRCDSSLTLFSNLTIQNGTLDFSNCTTTPYLQIHGSVGTYTNLTADATYQTTTLSCTSVSGFAAGDLLAVDATDAYVSTSGERCGEVVKIDSISSLDVTTSAPIADVYTTANTARCAKITTVDDVSLQDIKLVCSKAAPSSPRVISARSTLRLRLREVRVTGIAERGVELVGCVETSIDKCTFEDGAAGSFTIAIGNASQKTTIRDCTFTRCGSGVRQVGEVVTSSARGPTRNLLVENCSFEETTNGDAPISIGTNAQYVRVVRNDINIAGTAAPIGIAGPDVDIIGNTIYGSGTGDINLGVGTPVSRSGRAYRVRVSGNHCHNTACSITFTMGTTVSSPLSVLEITDNDSVAGGISVTVQDSSSSNDDITTLIISDNIFPAGAITVTSSHVNAGINSSQISRNTALNIAVTGTGAPPSLEEVEIDFNRVGGAVAKLIDVDTVERVTVSRNAIEGDATNTTHGIEITGVYNLGGTCDVERNRITGVITGGDGIFIDEAPTFTVTRNYVDSAGNGVRIDNTSQEFEGGVIAGNRIEGDDNGLVVDASDTTGSAGLTITGNYVEGNGGASEYVCDITGVITGIAIAGNTFRRGNDTDVNLHIAGDASGNIAQCSVAGNHFHNGTYGISVSNNAATTYRANNSFNSMATAITLGDFMPSEDVRHLRVTFDPSANAGERTIAVHSSTETLPDNAVIIRAYYFVHTTFTSAADTATISIGHANDVAGLVAAIAINDGSNPWDAGWHESTADGTVANFLTATAVGNRTIDFTVAVQALTAGKLILYIDYVVTD